MEDHPSNTIPTLWKEAIELFKAEADLSDREIADLESSHTPGEVFQDVAHSPWGKSSKKELRRRVSIQKTITVVLNVFGVLDTALNLAQTVQAFPALSIFSGAIRLLLRAIKGLWNVYDLIQQQFLAIHSFLERAQINLSTQAVRAGLDFVVVNVLKQMLHICAIATRYAKSGSFKRTAGNLLKALGPDDSLTSAISGLDTLLKYETPIIATQINHTISRMAHTLDESVLTTQKVDARIAAAGDVVLSQNTLIKKVDKRLSKVQNRQTETVAKVQHIGDRLSVSMSRIEGLSTSSRASLEEANEKLDSLISNIHESRWDDEMAQLRTWLEPVENYEDDFKHYLSLREPGTCDWAVSSSEPAGKTITQWMNGSTEDHAPVWLTGSPAQGKSVLAAYLIQRCREIKGNCLYFFCRHDDAAKRSVKRVLKTIAFSLVEIEDRVRERYLSQLKQAISLSNISVALLAEKLFQDALSWRVSPLHCIIDGIDELEPADRRDLATLLSMISKLKIRILIISRPDREVEDVFTENEIGVRIVRMNQKRTSRDIRRFVSAQVSRKLFDLPPDSQKTIIDRITKKSEGLFLWAKLALDIICRKRLEKAIFETLDDLTLVSHLKGLYSVIVTRISSECSDESEKSLARSLLTWTFSSIRPLSLSELECALQLRFGAIIGLKRTVRDLSGSLIEIGDDGQVAVVHATVKEFFMSEDAGEFRVALPWCHQYVAEVCFDYLCRNIPEFLHKAEDSPPESERLRQDYPFIEYASQYLFNHLQQCQISESLKRRIIRFLESRRVLTWIEALATLELTGVLSFAAEVLSGGVLGENRFGVYGRDLSRVGLLIDESIAAFPRTVHISLLCTFPDACVIAREVRDEFASCIKPGFIEWPAAKATRRRDQSWTKGTKAAMAFSPCGNYLTLGQMPESCSPIDIAVYQTQTYQRINRIAPFVFDQSARSMKVLPLGETYSFLQICCNASQDFRIVNAFAIGRIVFGKQIYSRCIVAEYSSQSPFHDGIWQHRLFDVPSDQTTPVLQLALNPRGRQIVAWHDRTLLFCRSIATGGITFGIHREILAADFMAINQDTYLLCVTDELIRVYNVHGQRLMDLPYPCSFGVSRFFIDPVGGTILAVKEGKERTYCLLGVKSDSRRNLSLSIRLREELVIQRYAGSLRGLVWDYDIWENGNRRALLAEKGAASQMYPHPTKSESLLQPSVKQYAFIVFDDSPTDHVRSTPQIPDPEISESVTEDCSVDHCFALLAKGKRENRFARHRDNIKPSPCRNFFAILGCDNGDHLPDCVSCLSKPTRLAIIDRSAVTPFLLWPLEECDVHGGGRINISFDQFSRLFVFTDHSTGFTVHLADPLEKFNLHYLGILRSPDVALPPAVYSRTHSEIYFVCHSNRMDLEIWAWQSQSFSANLYLHRKFDQLCVISALMHSSMLVFLTASGWLGTLPILDDSASATKHFLLPAEVMTPTEDEMVSCKMICDLNGLVEIVNSDGQCWQFVVQSLAQFLQSASGPEVYVNKFWAP